MWILRSLKSDDCYHLFVGQTSVGRKDTGILILNDPSISRNHAIVTVIHRKEDLSDLSKLPVLKIRDAESKYGTFRNGNKVEGEEILTDGDNVKFGQLESAFSVCYVPFVVTTSCIDSSVKEELKKKILQLGGHLISEWKPGCTHLVMSDIKITVKAVCCMISQKPLVTPGYVFDMVDNISNKLPEPVSNRYIPPVGETTIDNEKANFDIVPERKRIFENKFFIFLDKSQFKKMHYAVTLGGGDATYLTPDSKVDPQLILKTGVCVVQPQIRGGNVPAYQQQIFDLLHKNNKRMIQESDFGFAVTYCSTEIYCNPESNVGASQYAFGRLYSQTLTQQEACVHDIPGNSESSNKKSISSHPTEKSPVTQSVSFLQNSANCNLSGKKRKIRDSCHVDSIQQRSKQAKLENFLKITSSKSDDQGKASNSINIEGIALSSVKEEPQSADELEVDDNNSVIVDSLATVDCPAPVVVELKSSAESSAKCTVRNGPKEDKKHKPVQSSDVSSSDHSGFLNSRNAVSGLNAIAKGDDENLPRNLIQIEFADLVCQKPARTNILKSRNSSYCGKNFKKFRKVLPIGSRLLPQIIGGHELEPYSKTSKALDDVLNDSCDVQPTHNLDDDEAGEFDWESQPRQRRL